MSGGQALRHQVSRNRASYPGIANTVMSSMLRSSARACNDALADDNVDMYLSVNLRGVKLLDFDAISEIAERGYRATVERLESM